MADRSEELFQSIETIAKGLVSDLKFNKTVICTIKDNKDAKNGRYYVTDGTSNFYAFSENTDYLNDQSVYVLIPNDDYSNQKIITGRYLADEENNSYIYKVPWDSFVNITNNLYDNANNIDAQNHSSLIANGLVKEINLWSNENLNLKGYTTIGIKANFKTLLADLNTVSGHYGIRIKIRFVNDTTSQKKASSIIRQIEFNNDDMYGNTYNFETFYTQSKLFTISEPDKIIDKVWVTFFQDGDFKTAYGLNTPIASADNIFVKNVYLAFGYDLNSFDSDQVLLYTLNSSTYDATSTVEENKKILNLRWVHKLEDNSLQYYAEENEEYSSQMIIHWYKYNLATGIQDNLAGNFWEEIQDAQNKFQYIIQPDVMQAEEKYKIIIESPVVNEVLKNINDYELNTAKSNLEEKLQIYNDYKNNYETSSDLEIQNNLKLYENEYEEALNEYQFLVSKYSIETQYYESNILSLTNESIVADYASIDLINGLQIECDLDGYNGIYNIYNSTNEIVNNSESSKLRVLTAVFNSIITGQESLDTAEKITWKIPLTQTMIQKPVDGKEYNISQEDEYFESNDGTYCLITRDGTKATGNIGSSFLNATNQYFRIKPYLIENATNNIITCYVTKNNITYLASVSLTFGTSGTSGTDYTFILSWEDGINCIYHKDAYINAGIADESDKPIKIDAHLYDERNNEILLNNVEFSWVNSLIDSDFENNTNISFCDENGNSLLDDDNKILSRTNGPGYCYIHFDEKTSNFENYSILKAEVTTDTEDVKSNGESLGYKVILTAYLSIPLCYDLSITNIEGCTKVLYNSLGAKPQYYTGAYKMFSGDIELESQWFVNIKDLKNTNNNDPSIKNYYLSIEENTGYYYPVVPSLYFSANGICCILGKNVQKNTIAWIQPVIIQQDIYSSAMLNSWDGKLTINEDEGKIMTTMLGAGSKDSRNRFSGVLVGDITSEDQGIFGYHEGAQSFGFRTNGKAFIGKANKGRIEFDGNSGSIKSMSYSKGQTGMLIDLDDGIIDLLGSKYKNISTSYEEDAIYLYLDQNNKWQKINEIYNISVQSIDDLRKGPVQLAAEQDKENLIEQNLEKPYYNKFYTIIEATFYDENLIYCYQNNNEEWVQVNQQDTLELTNENAFYQGVIHLADGTISEENPDGISVLRDLNSEFYNKFYYFREINLENINELIPYDTYYYLDNNGRSVHPNMVKVLEVRNQEQFNLGPVNLAILQNKQDLVCNDTNKAGYNKFFSGKLVNDSDNNIEYEQTNSRVTIQALSPYIKVTESNKDIFQIAEDSSFIQTNNYDKNSEIGARITLKGADDNPDGTQENPSFELRAFSTSGGIKIGSISPFIKVNAKKNDQESVTIFQIGNKQSFIQTIDYDNGAKTGAQIVFNDVTSTSTKPSFKIKGYSTDGTGGVELSSTNPYFVVQAKKDNATTFTKLIEIGDRNYYLQSLDYQTENESQNIEGSGTKIDLNAGKITSYSFNLKAINKGVGTIYINSTNNSFPFQIIGDKIGNQNGGYFKINWNASFEAASPKGKNVKFKFDSINGKLDLENGDINGGSITISNYFYAEDGSVDIGNWHVRDMESHGGGSTESFYHGSWSTSKVGMSGNLDVSDKYYLWANGSDFWVNGSGTYIKNLTVNGATINNIQNTSHYKNAPLGTILDNIYNSINNDWSWLHKKIPNSLPDHSTFCPRQ